jgi:hypothetical protein
MPSGDEGRRCGGASLIAGAGKAADFDTERLRKVAAASALMARGRRMARVAFLLRGPIAALDGVQPVTEGLAKQAEFLALMQSKGADVEPDEDLLEDAVAFAGVSKYPARVKCALLGWMAWKDATAQAAPHAPGSAPTEESTA